MERYYNKNYYNIITMKDLVKKMTAKSYDGYEIKLNMIKNKWHLIIGDKLSGQTAPVKLYKTTLYVNCIHQGMINTLLFYKDIILNKIKEEFGDMILVDEIIFKFGSIN